MSIEKLERVLWRVRKKCKNHERIPNHELRRAIMYECGTHPNTYKTNRKALFTLKWIVSNGGNHVKLTDKDLTGDEA